MKHEERKKNLLDKYKGDTNQVTNLLYEWIISREINRQEFQILLGYACLAISKNNKQPYTGNDDPEMVIG